LVLAPAPAFATDGDIVGVVRDDTGAVLPGVTLSARNTDTGYERVTVSDEQGRYRFVKLPVGPYAISGELSGFRSVSRTGLKLTINARLTVDLTLNVGGVQETVTVEEEAPIVETTSSEVGVTFTRDTVDVLPLNGRNPTDLLLLAPGVARGVTRGGYAISGSLERNNSYTIDGVDNNDDIVGGARSALQQDVVREFQLVSNQFTAEFGRGAGGSVNVLTQSGSNDFRGRLNYFWRSNRFDAQSFLSKEAGEQKQPFDRKTFGGNFGGPILRDKTHFFVSYEQERETENDEFTLPDINYPAVGRFPAIQGGFRVQEQSTDNKALFGKLTHQFEPAHRLDLTFNYQKDDAPLSGCGGTDLTCYDFEGKDMLLVANYGWILSDRTLNEFRFARTRYDYLWSLPPEYRFPLHDRPGIDYGQQSNMPQGRDERHLIFMNTLSHTFRWKGDHDLRIGAEVNVERSGSFFDSNFGGTFRFTTDRPFDPNDRSTYPDRYTVRTGNSNLDRDMNLYSAFIQDNWRIRPNLTVNLGVRYDYEDLADHLRFTGQEGLFDSARLGLPADTSYRSDKNNVAPRLGFAWDPWSDAKTVIRGGLGWYYDQVFLNVQGNVYRFGVVPRTQDVTIDNPCYPDPTRTIPGLCGESIRPGAPTRSPTISSGLERSPYGLNTSIGVVRELFKDVAVSADYTRLRTDNWLIADDLNPRCTLSGSREGDCTGPIGSDASRPDRNWLALSHYATNGDKWYQGLLFSLHKRMSHNWQARLSYTLSRTEDNSGDFVADPQSYFHPEREKSLSTEDQRHRLVLSGMVRLPLDFQVSGIVTYANGRPFNITMGTDWNGNGNSEQDRPDSVPTAANIDQGTADTRPYNPEGPRGRGADGALGRNAGKGPDFFTIDLRLSKLVKAGGHRSLELLAEAFNLTNRVNETGYSGNVRSSNYYLRRRLRGTIGGTGTADPFQLQLGVRLNF
jgi:hypothetical protein